MFVAVKRFSNISILVLFSFLEWLRINQGMMWGITRAAVMEGVMWEAGALCFSNWSVIISFSPFVSLPSNQTTDKIGNLLSSSYPHYTHHLKNMSLGAVHLLRNTNLSLTATVLPCWGLRGLRGDEADKGVEGAGGAEEADRLMGMWGGWNGTTHECTILFWLLGSSGIDEYSK